MNRSKNSTLCVYIFIQNLFCKKCVGAQVVAFIIWSICLLINLSLILSWFYFMSKLYAIYLCLVVTYLASAYALVFLLCLVSMIYPDGKPSEMHRSLCRAINQLWQWAYYNLTLLYNWMNNDLLNWTYFWHLVSGFLL